MTTKHRHYDLAGGVRRIDGKWVVLLKAENFQSEEEARLFSALLCETVSGEDFAGKVDGIFDYTIRH